MNNYTSYTPKAIAALLRIMGRSCVILYNQGKGPSLVITHTQHNNVDCSCLTAVSHSAANLVSSSLHQETRTEVTRYPVCACVHVCIGRKALLWFCLKGGWEVWWTSTLNYYTAKEWFTSKWLFFLNDSNPNSPSLAPTNRLLLLVSTAVKAPATAAHFGCCRKHWWSPTNTSWTW